ncbi:MAG: energy transducer TonB [Gammaproteobacteria bacterium]|nr:MAG: energy transducer TonB [Gammaproteobacteria bacterium]
MLSYRYFYFSILGHGLLLLYIVARFLLLTQVPEQSAVQAYTYNISMPTASPASSLRGAKRRGNPHRLSSRFLGTTVRSAKVHNQLLILLHTAIAAKQNYPESALELQQSGTVRIQFLLYPDGHIENLTLLHPSGIASLDQAALNAVQAITPAKEAGRYLQNAEYFSVDVVFEL